MLTKEEREGYAAYLSTPQAKKVIKLLRHKAMAIHIDRDNPNPNAALYQSAQLALIRYIESLAGGNVDE
jgi:hypothetical protein